MDEMKSVEQINLIYTTRDITSLLSMKILNKKYIDHDVVVKFLKQ